MLDSRTVTGCVAADPPRIAGRCQARSGRRSVRIGAHERRLPSPSRAGPPVDDADLRGPFDRQAVQRALPAQPGQGPDGALDRLRPADADGLRRRSRARARRGRQGRRAGRAQGRHARAARRDPARPHEHVDDDQRDGGVAAGALHRRGGGERDRAGRAGGHDPERHHQGVPLARDLRVPAGAVDAADRRHGRLHGRRGPEVEPDQRLLLPPAGGGGDAGAGDRVRDVDRAGGARRGPAAGRRGQDGRGLRAHLVLRQRRRAVRRGAREAAGDERAVGGAGALALRRHGRAAAALPLRRAGQLAGADRVAAGEQRAADRARGAGGHDGPQRAGAGDPAAGVERGAGPAAAVGPAVVAADPAGARLRDRPARVPGHLRGLRRDGRAGRRAARGRARGDGAGGGAGRGGRGGAVHEVGAGRVPPRADRADRARRAGARGRQPLRGDRAVAADRGRRGRDPRRRPGRRGRGAARRSRRGAARATRPPSTPRWPSSRGSPPPTRT